MSSRCRRLWSRGARRPAAGRLSGFTLIELLVGLGLALCLAVAVAPLWISLETVGAREADRTVQSLQARVAVARLERDLRLASAAGCLFWAASPVVEASSSQVVFLERTGGPGPQDVPILVEWEIADGALMRRWGPCPTQEPAVYRHTLYADHKTMLEGLQDQSSFAYSLGETVVSGPIVQDDLASVDAVLLTLLVSSPAGGGPTPVTAVARVAR